MISIQSSADMARALDGSMDPDIKALLKLRRDQLQDGIDLDLAELAHFIVIQPGDTLSVIEAVAGVPLATSYVDGSRFGEPDFTSNFEWVERHPCGWFEAVLILSDDGFAVALFAPDHGDTNRELLALLLAHR